MRTVRGLENAKRILCAGRGLDLDTVPEHVQQKIAEVFGEPLPPIRVAELILRLVREGGDEAVRDLTRRLDGTELDALEIPGAAMEEAYDSVPHELVQALELAAGRIRRFHEASLPRGWVDFSEGYGELVNPVGRVGIYVPGGAAPLISTVLMTVVPARVAGVSEVMMATPSVQGQPPHPAILVAAHIAGVDRVFKIGGAQAVAAMAYGTETVPAVDMVCGPGGIFTTLAKKLLFGEVGIEGLYGPTETVVLADDSANPTLCAADLLAQAEHDALATPVLITTSQHIADAVRKEIAVRLERLDRAETARASIEQRGCIAIVDNLEEDFDLAMGLHPSMCA